MVYLKKFFLPSERAEIVFVKNERRTCFGTFYPFNIFPMKELDRVEFDGITMFYGGNGSGKSTLINVIARKINAARFSDYNGAPFFDDFVDMCYVEFGRTPKRSYVLTSDDVFDYVLGARSVNESIDERRNELVDKYINIKRDATINPDIGRWRGLDHYEEWCETREIISPSRSQSSYVRNRVVRDIDLLSNGETAMRYFIERMDSDAVYFLDEPENSLSIERQIELAEYITMTERVTNSQFIIATHSPIFLSTKNARIYNLDSCPASTCTWTELPNVRRYFEFFMEHRDDFE